MSDLSQSAFLNLRFNHFYSYSDYNAQINCCKPRGIQFGPTGPNGPIGATGGYGPTGSTGKSGPPGLAGPIGNLSSFTMNNLTSTNESITISGNVNNNGPYTISLEAINEDKLIGNNGNNISVLIRGDQFLKSINSYGYFKIPDGVVLIQVI